MIEMSAWQGMPRGLSVQMPPDALLSDRGRGVSRFPQFTFPCQLSLPKRFLQSGSLAQGNTHKANLAHPYQVHQPGLPQEMDWVALKQPCWPTLPKTRQLALLCQVATFCHKCTAEHIL